MISDKVKAALGTAFFLMTALLFQYESSFDSFFPGAHKIFRVETRLLPDDNGRLRQEATPFPLAEALKQEFEEIESAVRISRPFPKSVLGFVNRQKRAVRDGIWADPDFFSTFRIPMVYGRADTALADPDSLVLSEGLAHEMFGGIDPVGQTVIFNNMARCRVTGVFSDLPPNSHFRFSFIISREAAGERDAGWASGTVFTYIRLGKGKGPKAIKERLTGLLGKKGIGNNQLFLTQLRKIHLGGNGLSALGTNNRKSTLLFFLAVAFWLLLLSTLESGRHVPEEKKQAAETEGKKMAPLPASARHRNLSAQRLKESLLSALISVLPAAALALLLLPAFGHVMGMSVSTPVWPASVAAVLSALVFVTLSLFVQRILRAKTPSGGYETASLFHWFWKKGLAFFTAAALLGFLLNAGALFDKQNEEQPGFDQNNVLTIPFPSSDPEAVNRGAALKTELLRHPHITKAAFSLSTPFGHFAPALVSLEDREHKIPVSTTFADADFLETYGLLPVVAQPADASPEIQTDDWTCVINQAAASRLEAGGAAGSTLVGSRIEFGETRKFLISKVVKDFPFSAGSRGSEPLMIIIDPSGGTAYPFLSLRVSREDLANTLEFIKTRYDLLFPRDAFDYHTLWDDYKIYTGPSKAKKGFFLTAFLSAAALFLLSLTSPLRRLAAGSLPFWILYYAAVLVIVRPPLLYHGFGRMLEVPEFSFNMVFVGEKLFQVGGAIWLISNLLAQFFIIAWLGSAIITGTAWGLARLTSSHVLRFTRRKAAILPYIPALVLLFIFKGYDFPLTLSLALLTALGFSSLYTGIKTKNPAFRVILFAPLYTACFLATGGASLLFAGLAFLYEVVRRKKFIEAGLIAAAAAAVPYLLGIELIGLTSRDAYFRLTPLHTPAEGSILPGLLLLLSPAVSVLLGWVWTLISNLKKGEPMEAMNAVGSGAGTQTKGLMPFLRRRLPSYLPALVLLLLFAASLLLSTDRTKKILYTMMFHAQKGDWEKVILAAESLPLGTYSLYANYEINRALYHSGRFLDNMFNFPQLPESTILIPSEGERFVIQDITISETAMEMGALNIAEHLNLELMEVAGMHPDYVWNLARINLAQGHLETGRMFLNALSRNPIHRRRADRLLEITNRDPTLQNNPEIRALREMRLRDDVANISEMEMLQQLQTVNPLNRMAFEFLMVRYLLDRDMEKIVENIPRLRELGYQDIPLHIEEAVLLYENRFEKKASLLGMKIRPETVTRFQRFSEMLSSPSIQADEEAREAFIRDFGKSYSFYYVFDASGVRR